MNQKTTNSKLLYVKQTTGNIERILIFCFLLLCNNLKDYVGNKSLPLLSKTLSYKFSNSLQDRVRIIAGPAYTTIANKSICLI